MGRRFNCSCYLNTEQELLQIQQRLPIKIYSQKEGTEQDECGTGTGLRKQQWNLPAPNPQGEAPWFPLEANEASHGLA